MRTLSGRPWIEIKNVEDEEERLADEVRKLQNAGANMPPDLRASAFPSGTTGKAVGNGGSGRSVRLIAASGGLVGKSGMFSKPLSKKSGEVGITIDHLHRLNPKNVSAWNMKRSRG
ncbi:hypothetical protein RchiOBHm_Chr4g0390441 [Rosa chinensis]|uniref:Uncharacterized protein n=1 Tax=Rosa chinensis TaxID=74649 RepID=A0A2P6QQ96_ROSCH|nr:hypothetical protein RchiOBHm_Chr4g0390441 [Rosa chinensis]